ncbi:MAG: hypothetical protein LC795_07615 [Acidobacteria bacterium]|nr:hypothetical protein [Acidobacteriota bacterium]
MSKHSQDSHELTAGPAGLPSEHIAHRKPKITRKVVTLLCAALFLALAMTAAPDHMGGDFAAADRSEHMLAAQDKHMLALGAGHMQDVAGHLAGAVRAQHMDV